MQIQYFISKLQQQKRNFVIFSKRDTKQFCQHLNLYGQHCKTRVYYNFNIKMSKENEQKIARKLFQGGSTSNCRKENISEGKILQQKNTYELLKDRIETQQKQRVKSKYQRTIKGKESELSDIINKCNNLQLVLKREKGINETLTAEKQQLNKTIDKLIRQAGDKQINEQEVLKSKAKLEQQNKQLINQSKESLKKVLEAQTRLQKLQRQLSISSKKEKQALKDVIDKLQAKLRIKEKQQQKIESLIKQKASEYDETIRCKNEQIAYLQAEYAKLKVQNEIITQQLYDNQSRQKETYQQFNNDIQLLTRRMKEIEKNKQLRQAQLQIGIQKFKGTLNLQTQEIEILKQLQDFSKQLKNKQQDQQQTIRIQQLQREIQACRKINKEFQDKNQILEEELLFFKGQAVKNSEFSTAFKSHLSSMSENIQAKENQNVQRVHKSMLANEITINGLIDQRFCSLQLKEKPRDRTDSSWTKPKQQGSATSLTVKKKSANDFLKQQLQTKKKSLIYIMYKHNQEQETIKRQVKKSTTTVQSLQKRRSCSLGTLISAKCKSQLQ